MSWPDPAPGAEQGAGPLAGIRVLDFSALLPGPYTTQILADLGADVIKVEPPAGDHARHIAGIYDTANRNKRAIVADLKQDADRAACLRLAEDADVVIEGFRPGVAARLGIAYDDIRAVRPDVVYCSISGFGQTGPDRDKPGHDLTYLAASGALSYPAHWGEPPRRSAVPAGDLAAASFATIAILASLRERDRTGEGCYLDVAISDATMAFVAPRGGRNFSVTGEQRLSAYPVNDLYEASDGEVVAVAAVEEKFWERLRALLTEYEPGLADARFDDQAGRRRHGDDLKALLAAALRRHPARHWAELFERNDIPGERVVTLAEAVHGPQAQARGIVMRRGEDEQIVFPVLRNGEVMGQFRSAPPRLGEHTDEVLGGLGSGRDRAPGPAGPR